VTGRPPLLLAAHGTRDPAGVAGFIAFAERLAKLAATHGTDVAGGFIELSRPALREAVAELAGLGHRRVVAVPLMLAAAGHAKGDVPASLARERDRHPGLTWEYGRTLGPHPVLIDLLALRVAAVAGDPAAVGPDRNAGAGPDRNAGAGPDRNAGAGPDRNAGAGEPPAVLVVGRGSTDPDANADVVKTARLLWEGRDFPLAETAFVSLARPSVTEGLDRCLALGARRVVVARYFLFQGVLPDRVADQAAAWADAHPGIDVLVSDVIGDCDELAGLVWERYTEAVSGSFRINCDMCIYRIALPGFEHRVGEPQRPHDHPHDPVGHTHAH
jgi:sirohydrochlorin cobaltochelatase